MTKYLWLLLSLITSAAAAQNTITVTEPFDNGRFQWDEFYEDTKSGSIIDGFYALENKSDKSVAITVTDLPIDTDKNFKLMVKILVPKFKDNSLFGLIFDYQDEHNYSDFVVAEKKYQINNIVAGISSRSRQGGIILKAEKDKEVVIEVEKKASKLKFSVDNMEVVTITRKLRYGTLGFIVKNANTILIDEMTIEQRVDD